MRERGLESQYFNSGAFGFGSGVPTYVAGWIGPQDPTIRAGARQFTRNVPMPYAATLADLAALAWQKVLPGPAWIMPKSHWAYELDYGSKAWLPDALRNTGVNPAALEARNNAPAIEFLPDETPRFTAFVRSLLENLVGSDFSLAFPDHPVICTIHHHKQLWWVGDNQAIVQGIEGLIR